MPTPKIEKVLKDGVWLWEVSYAGTAQYHKQDWQAKWLYEQAVQVYSRKVWELRPHEMEPQLGDLRMT